jgi:uncharacterized protein YbcV (DUF1398 family)
MFTLEQIQAAHQKIQSGADFPAYIQELKKLGVTFYEIFVADGHADYYGDENYNLSSGASYPAIDIKETTENDSFKTCLKEHQNGKTDYPTFITDCARFGIDKWAVSLNKMTCTYYDTQGNKVLVESIPH